VASEPEKGFSIILLMAVTEKAQRIEFSMQVNGVRGKRAPISRRAR
jgi:hypothetical protein